MTLNRIKFFAITAAVAASFTGEVYAQAARPAPGTAVPGTATTTSGGPASGAAISRGVPAISGVVPNRAELAGSAFAKLDARSRGYLTLEDLRQLEGFESAFRQADQNGDGRLNASEFNSAWGAYTGNVR